MAGISKIGELEVRKRALAAQSEVYRETLKAEVANLRLHSAGFIHKVERIRRIGPWLMLAVPVAAPLLGLLGRKKPQAPKPSRLKGGIATGLMALRLYRKYGPLMRGLVAHFRNKRNGPAEERAP